VQLARRLGAAAGLHRTVLHTEQVEPAVVVVIDPRDAAAHRLLDVMAFGRRVEVPEVDAGRGGDILEPRKARRGLEIGNRVLVLWQGYLWRAPPRCSPEAGDQAGH